MVATRSCRGALAALMLSAAADVDDENGRVSVWKLEAAAVR